MYKWHQEKLGKVADVKMSNVDKKTDENERTIRLCNYTDVYKNSFIDKRKTESFMVASCNENEYEKFLLREGQVAITKDSETPNDIGIPTYISEDFIDVVLGYHLALFTPNIDKLDGKFLYYWLNTKQAKRYFENNAGGSGQRCSLPLVILKEIPLSLPSISYQKNVSQFLFNIDSKIELNNRINAELEAMAKTLYDYWFVQFDFPNEHGNPYKSSGGKMVYNKELKREIPEGWEVKKIGNILRTELGGTPSTAVTSYWKGNIPWLNSGEIANFPIIESEEHITQEAIDSSSTTLMPAGTCVVSITRHLRPSILVIDACANQSVVGIFETENIKSSFIYPYLKNEIPRYMTVRTGAQQPHINKGTIEDSFIIIPPDKILTYYYSKANGLYNLIINKSFESRLLASLRDWLLPMLMNGQVTVKEAEGRVVETFGFAKESQRMAAEPEGKYSDSKKT